MEAKYQSNSNIVWSESPLNPLAVNTSCEILSPKSVYNYENIHPELTSEDIEGLLVNHEDISYHFESYVAQNFVEQLTEKSYRKGVYIKTEKNFAELAIDNALDLRSLRVFQEVSNDAVKDFTLAIEDAIKASQKRAEAQRKEIEADILSMDGMRVQHFDEEVENAYNDWLEETYGWRK